MPLIMVLPIWQMRSCWIINVFNQLILLTCTIYHPKDTFVNGWLWSLLCLCSTSHPVMQLHSSIKLNTPLLILFWPLCLHLWLLRCRDPIRQKQTCLCLADGKAVIIIITCSLGTFFTSIKRRLVRGVRSSVKN